MVVSKLDKEIRLELPESGTFPFALETLLIPGPLPLLEVMLLKVMSARS